MHRRFSKELLSSKRVPRKLRGTRFLTRRSPAAHRHVNTDKHARHAERDLKIPFSPINVKY